MNTENNHQNQHYVPKFLIKNFVDSDGRVYSLDIRTEIITKLPPKKAGADVGFYEFLIDGNDISFEDRLQRIEHRASIVFHKIIKNESLHGLNDKERHSLAEFVSVQSFRTKAFREGLGITEQEEIANIFEVLWENLNFVTTEIENRKWMLMQIHDDEVFYLGDHPVVLQNIVNPEGAQSLGFDVLNVEGYLPLTPKLALNFPCRSNSDELISTYETNIAILNKFDALRNSGHMLLSIEVNEIIQLRNALGRLKDMYESYTIGSPVKCISENVENFNYLQCSFAHCNLFSNDGSFTFAKHVFKNTPQYKNTVKTRLLTLRSGKRTK